MKKIVLLLTILFCQHHISNAQWQQTNGPYGGNIGNLAANETTIFAGVGGAGIFVSSDNGSTWTPSNIGLTNYSITSLSITESKVYVGTVNDLFVSENDGQTWINITNNLPNNSFVYSVAENNSSIFCSVAGYGIYKSVNSGLSWTAANSGLTTTVIKKLVVKESKIFAATLTGVFVSTDNGLSWTITSSGLPYNNEVTNMVVSGNSIVVSTTEGVGIYSSDNDGIGWQPANGGINFNIAELASVGAMIFAGSEGVAGLYYSENMGQTWNSIDTLENQGIMSVIASGSTVFMSTFQSGLYIADTSDILNWHQSNNGLIASGVDMLEVISNNIYAGTSGDGIFMSANEGDNWNRVAGTEQIIYSQGIVADGNYIYASTSSGILLSTDNGLSCAPPPNNTLPWGINGITIHNNKLIIGKVNELYSSADSGTTWVNFASLPTHSFWPLYFLSLNDTLFVASPSGGGYMLTDSGNTYSVIGNLINLEFRALEKNNAGLFAATRTGGIYFLANDSIDWITVNTGLTDLDVTSLEQYDNDLFAGTYGGGVFVSEDNGLNWAEINSNLFDKVVLSLTIKDNYLYAGTNVSGVWKRPLWQIVDGINSNYDKPFLIFPNPARTTLTIQSPEKITSLKIIDITGREIQAVTLSLVEGQTTVDISHLQQGIYVFIINGSAARKVVVK